MKHRAKSLHVTIVAVSEKTNKQKNILCAILWYYGILCRPYTVVANFNKFTEPSIAAICSENGVCMVFGLLFLISKCIQFYTLIWQLECSPSCSGAQRNRSPKNEHLVIIYSPMSIKPHMVFFVQNQTRDSFVFAFYNGN